MLTAWYAKTGRSAKGGLTAIGATRWAVAGPPCKTHCINHAATATRPSHPASHPSTDPPAHRPTDPPTDPHLPPIHPFLSPVHSTLLAMIFANETLIRSEEYRGKLFRWVGARGSQ